jgi:hypothetical protein
VLGSVGVEEGVAVVRLVARSGVQRSHQRGEARAHSPLLAAVRGMAYSMQQCMILVSGMDSAISAAAVSAAPSFFTAVQDARR